MLFYLFVFKASVLAEFIDAQKLVVAFVEVFSDLLHQTGALTITFAGYALYVFRVDADSFDFCFHTLYRALGGLWWVFDRFCVLLVICCWLC